MTDVSSRDSSGVRPSRVVRRPPHNEPVSPMIVNKSHRETGEMEPETLAGFTAAAEALRYDVADPVAFLKLQQALCFKWGQED